MNAELLVNLLLELNVLNVQAIERNLRQIGAHAKYPQIQTWLMSTARNYIINMEEKEALEGEFSKVMPRPPKYKGEQPEELPDWAQSSLQQKRTVHFFRDIQPQRRKLWQLIETIVDWMNTIPTNDPILGRLDRISFQDAAIKAQEWHDKLYLCARCGKSKDEHNDYGKCPGLEGYKYTAGYWKHVKDRPKTVMTLDNGYRWVELTTDAHVTREGTLMNHCIGSSSMHNFRNYRYFSLRDPDNMPHVTLELIPAGNGFTTRQVKGNTNRKPAEKYQPMIRAFFDKFHVKVVGDSSHVDQ